MERAYKFTHVSYNILSQESVILEDDFQLERVLVVSMLVIQHLVQLSCQRGENENARKCYGELGQIRAYFQEMEEDIPYVTERIVAPAASERYSGTYRVI